MTRKYALPSRENRSRYIQENFDAIAPNYNRFNDAITLGMHRRWKNRAIQAAGLTHPFNALDLCCGTGDLTLRLLALAGPGSTVTALDFSDSMLGILQKRVPADKRRMLHCRAGDATDLSFQAADSLDAITIGFGLRNIQNRGQALKEVWRVLCPGGRLVILEVGKVTLPVIAGLHALFFRKIVPLIGYLLEGKKNEMYDYLPASADIYPSQLEMVLELKAAGFTDVHYKNFMFGATALHVAMKP